MFDWIFGSKKEEKPKEVVDDIPPGDLWAYDCLTQYLASPLWRIPILDFIETNSIAFQDEEENKFQYTKIFEEFRNLVSALVDNMMEEIGIGEQLLEKCLLKGLRSKHRKHFQQILVCDNFLAFKRIMLKKNKELEVEALRQLQLKDASFVGNNKLDEMELERMELEKAIAISMALKDKIDEEEERQIQEAIRLSELQEQKRVEAELKKSEESKVKKYEPLPPLIPIGTTIKEKPIEELKKETHILTEELSKMKLEQPKSNISNEDAEMRKKRLLEQRELLRKQKKEERTEELKQFVEGKTEVEELGIKPAKVSQEEIERRKKLMEKLKKQLD